MKDPAHYEIANPLFNCLVPCSVLLSNYIISTLFQEWAYSLHWTCLTCCFWGLTVLVSKTLSKITVFLFEILLYSIIFAKSYHILSLLRMFIFAKNSSFAFNFPLVVPVGHFEKVFKGPSVLANCSFVRERSRFFRHTHLFALVQHVCTVLVSCAIRWLC